MSHKKTTAKAVGKRLSRKGFRAAERRLLRGDKQRGGRWSFDYHTPGSLRADKLPLDGG